MPLTKLQFRPGINRDVTTTGNEGGWRDCDKIRFRLGFPETIGGWEKLSNNQFLGVARDLHSWTALNSTSYIAVGTNLKQYIVRGSSFFDITPLRETTAAGGVTFSATSGSAVITVSDTGHGAIAGDYVTFSGAVSLGGNITADILNAEFSITAVNSANEYTITASVAANASDTGNGGAAVVGAYQISVGLETAVTGTGWGADAWGQGGWGSPADTSIAGATLRLWSQDNYGEDLFSCIRDRGVYYWDASSGVAARGVALEDLAGANRAPTIARVVMTSDQSRHAIAFGCDDEFASGTQDPSLIRFSNAEDITDWETRTDNTAGSLRISSGSGIVTAVKTRQQILVFTDISLHVLQYVGAPFTFGLQEVSTSTTISSPNAAVAVGDSVYWMGEGDFYVYNGREQVIPCTVREYVFDDFNVQQAEKVFGGHNSEHSEVWWFYPSSDSQTNNRYVIYNYAQQIWYYGTLDRSAWEARGVFGYSIAAGQDGYLYYQEYGVNDGSQNPSVGINAYIESSPVDMGEGDRYMLASRVLPDITFRNSTGTPSVTLTISAQDYPGGGFNSADEANPVTRTATVPVEQFTTEQHIRIRGRALAMRIESDQRNTAWRLGTPFIDVRPDGRR